VVHEHSKEGGSILPLPKSAIFKGLKISMFTQVGSFDVSERQGFESPATPHPPEPGKRHEWRSSPRRPPLSTTVRPFQNIYSRSFSNFPESRRTLAGHMFYLYSTDSVCISSQSVCGLHSTSCLLHMPLVYYLVYLTRCALVDTFEK
jgi:hypothetical protein